MYAAGESLWSQLEGAGPCEPVGGAFISAAQNELTKVPAVPQFSAEDTQPKVACASPGTIQ